MISDLGVIKSFLWASPAVREQRDK